MSEAKEKARLRAAAWRAANPEKAKEVQRRSNAKRRANPETAKAISAYQARYRAENAETLRHKERERKFGISRQKYADLFHSQRGVCAICFQPETATRKGVIKALAVDHDHQTGEVRGLLCYECNTGIGKLKDDPEVLRNAADYLERFKF
jgi:Recombination endonuclease VII